MIKIEKSGLILEYLEQMFAGYELPSEILLEEEDIAASKGQCAKQHPEETPEQHYARSVARCAWKKYGASRDAEVTAGKVGAESSSARNLAYIHDTLKREVPNVHIALTQLAQEVGKQTVAAEQVAGSVSEVEKSVDDHAAEFRNDFQQAESRFYAKAWEAAKWLIAWGVTVLILLSVIAVRGHAQIDVIKLQENGTTKANYAAPFTINFTSGCTLTKTGSIMGVACSGGGGSPIYLVSSYSGATLGDKIIACFAALPSTGGVCDARDITGAQSITSNIFSGMTKPVTLLLGYVTITDSSCWIIPNDGATPPNQASIHIQGVGIDAGSTTAGKTPTSGTIIDNSCSTGVAKLDTRGQGVLEMDGITWMDSSGASLPFFQTTNTIAKIHDNQFYGSKNGTACNQDVIIFGGTTTNVDASSTAAFQGYGSYVTHNFGNHIRRLFYGRIYVNNVQVTQNTVWVESGAGTGGAAIEFVATTSTNVGNVVRDNLIEVTNYPYGIKFTQNGFNNTIAGNGFFDATVTHLAGIRFESTSEYNLVEDGYRNDSYALVSEDAGSLGTNTVITSHQSQTSVLPQFYKFTAASGVQMTNASVGSPMYNMKLTTTNDEFFTGITTSGGAAWNLYVNPAGGATETLAKIIRQDANQYKLFLNGPATSRVEGVADLRVAAASGSTTWLGTTATANAILINDTTTTFNNTNSNFATGFQIAGAAASGKIPIGNGTNFVASGYTIPTSAGTAGKYLRWDGTNVITSTGSASGVGTPTACSGQFVTAFTLNADAAPTSTCTTATASNVGLGSVTNDAQTKAAIVPNTAPSAGQVLVGNAGGTAYAPVSMSSDATLASTGALTLASVVSASTCGDSTHSCGLTYDAKGRITAATNNAISGGSGTAATVDLTTHGVPASTAETSLCQKGYASGAIASGSVLELTVQGHTTAGSSGANIIIYWKDNTTLDGGGTAFAIKSIPASQSFSFRCSLGLRSSTSAIGQCAYVNGNTSVIEVPTATAGLTTVSPLNTMTMTFAAQNGASSLNAIVVDMCTVRPINF